MKASRKKFSADNDECILTFFATFMKNYRKLEID
jgi:hypothetical protein